MNAIGKGRPPTETPADHAWNTMIDRIDMFGADDRARLAAAEADLASASAEAAAEGGRHVPAVAASPRRMRRGMVAAVAIVLCVALTASARLLWTGSRSLLTMPFSTVIELLNDPSSPPNDRSRAVGVVTQVIALGIDTMQTLEASSDSPPELVSLAQGRLQVIRPLLDGGVVPRELYASWKESNRVALDATQPLSERLRGARLSAALSATGLVALRDMITDGGSLAETRRIHLGQIERQLRH
ncbi:MAG: hypothetical protein AB7O97_05360 [Planctomycetota bacterium]